MNNTIRVNILNTGTFMGIKTPVYNLPMDFETYQLLREMGFMIEQYTPKAVKVESVKPVPSVNEKPVMKAAAKSVTTSNVSTEPEYWMTKPTYTEEELSKMSKKELADILNYRGHYSAKTGLRDRLAPKFNDNRATLIEKIMETNKV